MGALDSVLTNNVAAIIMASLFIWYLNKRDTCFQETLDKLSEAINDLRKEMNKIKS